MHCTDEREQPASATHKIEIHQTGDQFVATVPAIDAVVTGATEEAALREAERAIVARMIEEAEKRKRRQRGKGHTVA
jgi:predicted RNase H-like HicB family nuclease